MSVPNQRIVTINKALCNEQNIYTKINIAALNQAAASLVSKGGFKLWIYLAKNQDKYKLELSSADFIKWSGLSRTSYQTAFDELLQQGYLREQGGNHYIFNELPQHQEEQAAAFKY
jgi:hypothetical protein